MDGEQGQEREGAAGTRPGSLGGQARLVQNLLAVMALLAGISIALDISQVMMLSQAGSEAEPTIGVEGAASGTQGLGSGVASLITLLNLATEVAFLVWFRRAYFHPALPADRLRFRRGLVVLSWFVPILNLVRPKQIMDDIWRASDPDPRGPASVPDRKPVSGLLNAWWSIWLVSLAVAWVVLLAGVEATASEPRRVAVTYLVSDVVGLASAVVSFLLVKRVTRRIEERAARLPATATP
jgi:Domain of unknown function (DUF4328)